MSGAQFAYDRDACIDAARAAKARKLAAVMRKAGATLEQVVGASDETKALAARCAGVKLSDGTWGRVVAAYAQEEA